MRILWFRSFVASALSAYDTKTPLLYREKTKCGRKDRFIFPLQIKSNSSVCVPLCCFGFRTFQKKNRLKWNARATDLEYIKSVFIFW